MFKKLASDMIGLSDVGSIIDPSNYDSTDSDDYVLHEDGEEIYFVIKSKADEYCFTNQALIHLDGTSAMDKKRMLKRFTYKANQIDHVRLETAGSLDRDVEIKFDMGGIAYSIDVDKKQLNKLKGLYKSLLKISSLQQENAHSLSLSERSIQVVAKTLGGVGNAPTKEEFQAINEYVFQWEQESYNQYNKHEYANVFNTFVK